MFKRNIGIDQYVRTVVSAPLVGADTHTNDLAIALTNAAGVSIAHILVITSGAPEANSNGRGA